MQIKWKKFFKSRYMYKTVYLVAMNIVPVMRKQQFRTY